MLTDLRFAISAMRRRPLVSLAVILTLGIGIGANAAIFRAFNSAFLRPLPFANADRLMRLVLASPDASARLSPRPDVFLAVRDHNRVFSSLVAQRYNDFTLSVGGEPHQIAGIQVSEGWARTLGVEAQHGRTFNAAEERQGGGAGVALISDAMWRNRFAGDRAILGRPITLNGRPYAIVGILPAGVRFPYEADVWIPARFDQQVEATWGLNIVGRLRDGITPEVAATELAALSPRLEAVRAPHQMKLLPIPLRDALLEDEGPIVIAVTFASAFLLLLVAVNVANLLTVHSLSRQREFAVRSALGATFGDHLRQTMTEGLLLAIAGGVVGLGIAAASTSFLTVLVPEDFAYVFADVPIDGGVLVYFALVVLAVGVAFGAIPALRMARRDLHRFLIGASRTTEERPAKWRAAFTTAGQIALALVLLAGAYSVVRDVQRRLDLDVGYEKRGLLLARISLPAERYAEASDRDPFFDAVVNGVQAIPGVDAAGTINLFPMPSGGALIARLEGEGVAYRPESPMLAHNRFVHGSLMEAMRLRLIGGRFLTTDEMHRGDPVAVISSSVAQSLWPGQNPVGKQIRNRRLDDAPWLRVVGVIADLEESYADTRRSIWTPVKLNTENASAAQAAIVVRSSVSTESLARSVQEAVRRIDPALAVYEIATAEETYRNTLRGRESARTLTSAFGLLGLIVAAIGVYASMSFTMSRRTREIAIHIALGATPRLLTRQFLRTAAFVVGAGVIAGVAGTFVVSRVAGSVIAAFPISFGSLAVAGAILVPVALTASWVPLRRAMRLDPRAALQSE